jgi:hypothetical protein
MNQFKTYTNLCQSCGMPLEKDPGKGGTNKDLTKSNKYCSYCFGKGKFLDEGLTLQEKIEKNVMMSALKMNLTDAQARELAEQILPTLERWKKIT